MKVFDNLPLTLLWAVVCSCSTTENIPRVEILPNESGLEIGEFVVHQPQTLMGNYPSSQSPPDVSSGVSTHVKRIHPLRNKDPRYFTPAAGTLHVVSIEHPENYYDGFGESIEEWTTFLALGKNTDAETFSQFTSGQIGEIPWINGGRSFHGKFRHVEFPWGNAVMFLTTYVQGPTDSPVNNDMLVLVTQGFSNDGKYAINGRFEIHHPDLPDSIYADIPQGKMLFSLGDECAEVEAWLTAQANDSFEPTITSYEHLLNALVIDGN